MKKHLKWIIPLAVVVVLGIVAVVIFVVPMLRPWETIIYEPGTVIYQSEKVTATVVEPTPNRNEVLGYFPSPSPEETFGEHPVIATGIVRNIREVEISYIDVDGLTTHVVTLFDFHVSSYVKETSLKMSRKRVLTVGWPSSSYWYDPSCPSLSEGAEFLLFMHVMNDLDYEDILERKGYTDTWATGACYAAFKKSMGKYTINSRFEAYLTDEEKSRAATDLVAIIKKQVREYS